MGASGHERSLGDDGNVLKLDYGDGCTTLSVYSESLNSMLKTSSFYNMYIMPQ